MTGAQKPWKVWRLYTGITTELKGGKAKVAK